MKRYISSFAFLKVGFWLMVFFLGGCQTFLGKNTTANNWIPSKDGCMIHYTDAGPGETALFFVHGWSNHSGYWRQQGAYFSTRYRVITVDLAGHGQSGQQRKRYTMAEFGADVAAVSEKLNLRKIILIGQSTMGGAVIVEAALRLPGRVAGLVAVDAFTSRFQWPKPEQIADRIEPFRQDFAKATERMVRPLFGTGTTHTLVDSTIRDMVQTPAEVGISAMENLFLWKIHDAESALGALPAPLLHINAGPTHTKPAFSENVFWVPGTGHFIPQENPEGFNTVLRQAIEKLERLSP